MRRETGKHGCNENAHRRRTEGGEDCRAKERGRNAREQAHAHTHPRGRRRKGRGRRRGGGDRENAWWRVEERLEVRVDGRRDAGAGCSQRDDEDEKKLQQSVEDADAVFLATKCPALIPSLRPSSPLYFPPRAAVCVHVCRREMRYPVPVAVFFYIWGVNISHPRLSLHPECTAVCVDSRGREVRTPSTCCFLSWHLGANWKVYLSSSSFFFPQSPQWCVCVKVCCGREAGPPSTCCPISLHLGANGEISLFLSSLFPSARTALCAVVDNFCGRGMRGPALIALSLLRLGEKGWNRCYFCLPPSFP